MSESIEDIIRRIVRERAPHHCTHCAEAQIKHMVSRFLAWPLPHNFNPDAGISFKKTFNEHTDHPMENKPSGTNLFDATQADAMVRYMLAEWRGCLLGPEKEAA